MRSFVQIKPSRNGKITLLFTDIGKSCLSRKFRVSKICLLTLLAKIKFLRKFPNLQYPSLSKHIHIGLFSRARCSKEVSEKKTHSQYAVVYSFVTYI